eukprot:SAG31_NODE_3523_length_4160_cov_6.950997_4_plen_263_part_00
MSNEDSSRLGAEVEMLARDALSILAEMQQAGTSLHLAGGSRLLETQRALKQLLNDKQPEVASQASMRPPGSLEKLKRENPGWASMQTVDFSTQVGDTIGGRSEVLQELREKALVARQIRDQTEAETRRAKRKLLQQRDAIAAGFGPLVQRNEKLRDSAELAWGHVLRCREPEREDLPAVARSSRESERPVARHPVAADVDTHIIDLRAELGLPAALEKLLEHDWSSTATQFSEAVARGGDHNHHADAKCKVNSDGVASAPEG